MQQVISTTYKYTSKKENTPTNRGLFHDFRFSLGYDNLQQDGISEAVGSLTVFLHTAVHANRESANIRCFSRLFIPVYIFTYR